MKQTFKEWINEKQNGIKKMNSYLPVPIDHDEYEIKMQELTLKQTRWCELTKQKCEEMIGREISWAEYDIFFIPFMSKCVLFYGKLRNPENGEDIKSYFIDRSIKIISSVCYVLGIDSNDSNNNEIIKEAIQVQYEISMLQYLENSNLTKQ